MLSVHLNKPSTYMKGSLKFPVVFVSILKKFMLYMHVSLKQKQGEYICA